MTRSTLQPRAQCSARPGRPAAFTLVELVVSMAIMVLLIGSMTSAILIASHALPDRQDPVSAAAEAAEIVDQIAGECAYATAVTEARAKVLEFTVADRGHGAAGPETIRYAWSGIPGDPLTRQYNGGSVLTVCSNVQDFDLTWFTFMKPLETAPRVLLVVSNASNLSADDQSRKTTMESWGCTVQTISSTANQDSFDTAVKTVDVAFVSEEVSGISLGTKLRDARIGVLVERRALYDEFGIALDSDVTIVDSIEIVDNTHEITSGLSLGVRTIASSAVGLTITTGTLGDGARVLGGENVMGVIRPMLVAIDSGGELCDGERAAGRRVKLPSGQTGSFDFSQLNASGLLLVQRSLNWAAAPQAFSGVRVVLQIGTDAASRVETRVDIFNAPTVNQQ